MATPPLPSDFKEFLRLLISHQVEFLLIGGHAVGYYGYVRATADMDIWVRSDAGNASRIVSAIRDFGFSPRAERGALLTAIQDRSNGCSTIEDRIAHLYLRCNVRRMLAGTRRDHS